jgi:hypothetical protein
MNMGRFSEVLERLKGMNLSRVKQVVFVVTAFIMIMLIIVIVSNKGSAKKTPYTKVTILPTMDKPKKELDYEFIKFDTIKMPNFDPVEQPIAEPPRQIDPVVFTENIDQPKVTSGTVKKSANSNSTEVESTSPEPAISFQSRAVNQNPNMIVTNNLAEGAVQNGSTPSSSYAGLQSTLVKVVLPNRTPVANGSLVEARVLRDSKWGNVFIPKRTKIIGVASLMNRRVTIDFQEIYISDNSRSCRGRAFDSKRLLGLSYSPVNSEAKRVALEELRDAVSGVPVLGRVADRATYSTDYYDQDVSVLDEGLEFYVLIESVY